MTYLFGYWGNTAEKLVQMVFINPNEKPTPPKSRGSHAGLGREGGERFGEKGGDASPKFLLPFCNYFNNLWCSMGTLPDLIKKIGLLF